MSECCVCVYKTSDSQTAGVIFRLARGSRLHYHTVFPSLLQRCKTSPDWPLVTSSHPQHQSSLKGRTEGGKIDTDTEEYIEEGELVRAKKSWRGGLFQPWLPLCLDRERLERLARPENNVSQHGTYAAANVRGHNIMKSVRLQCHPRCCGNSLWTAICISPESVRVNRLLDLCVCVVSVHFIQSSLAPYKTVTQSFPCTLTNYYNSAVE